MFTSLTVATALVLGAPALKDKEPLGTGPGYLGITFQKDEGGLRVTDLKENAPAAKAGLKVEDLIVKVDDTSVKDADTGELVKMIGGMRPGTVVAVEVRRGSETLTLKVKLGPRPPDFQPQPSRIPPPPDPQP
ncbi:MAG TPA: PDZ domain-containing protein [Gemmataceae bacterium]|nr:PDZ domain-containing protein [Gemmataceae bacterium]